MLKLLVLFPKRIYTSKMSSVRRHAIEMLMQRDDLDIVLSGQGWEGYNTEKTLQANIDALHPKAQAIFWYKPLGLKDVKPLKKPAERKIPAVVAYNEAYWGNWAALKECQDTRTDLAICHHKEDMARFDDGKPGFHPRLDWIPHAAKTQIYVDAARSWPGRDIVCHVTGNLNRDIYPLRAKIADLVRDGKIPGKIRKHPGYKLSSQSACDAQVADYAIAMGKTKLAIVCASKYNYGLAKYVEAAMAGACVVGDVPPDFADTIGPHMLQIDKNASAEDICKQIRTALQDESRLESMAALGQQAAMRFHSMERYTTQLVHRIHTLVEQQQVSKDA